MESYDPKSLSMMQKVVAKSGIDERHACGAVAGAPAASYFPSLEGPRARAALWEEHAPKLAVAAARQALAQWPGGTAADVTHVVVHSCTGFSAPGLDYELIAALGLRSDTRKLGVNFMGCFGFFTAAYVARQIVAADDTGAAVVLVVCAETSSVHLSATPTPELIVGNALFADGAAAAVITHAGFVGAAGAPRALGPPPAADAPPEPGARTRPFRLAGRGYEWAIGPMSSEVVPGSAGAMTWKQTAQGGRYDMFLDKSIPEALTRVFLTHGASLLSRVGVDAAERAARGLAWAVHPGGKAILGGVETVLRTLGLPTAGLPDSHAVLKEYGNMSSATMPFVLQRVLTGEAGAHAGNVFFAGFGPGLTVEFGRLYKHYPGDAAPTAGGRARPAEPAPGAAAAPAEGEPLAPPA